MEQAINSQHFHIEGIRCARCIHAIESALQHEPAVTQARVNMSTNRLTLAGQGEYSLIHHFTQLIESLGYKVSASDAPATDHDDAKHLLRCMAVAGFAMGNIMLISFALWSSEQQVMGLATRDLLHWISALIALPTIAYAGRPFFASAWGVLRHGRTNMDVPISLALILASGMSLFETFHHGEHAYFDSAVMLLFFLLIGRWLDARARGKARENAGNLLAMMQGSATVVEEDGTQRTVPIKELRENRVIRIATGEKIPTDATIIEGRSEIDTSLVTGETLPHAVTEGDTVYGGTLNLSAPLTARVLKASDDSLLADIIRLMEQAEQGRAHYVRLADKAAALYTPVVHTLAACAFFGWYLVGGIAWQEALLIAITTLIITCPCALGLAVPVVQVLATSWLMSRGMLVKSGDALERLARIDTVLFDKTGTLTKGAPALVGDYPEDRLQLAASLAAHSKHPYSQAISRAYDGALLTLDGIREIPGTGVEGVYDGQPVFLGKQKEEVTEDATPPSSDGSSHIWLYQTGKEACVFQLCDPLRDDSKDIVSALKQAQMDIHLLSGDRRTTVENVANTLDINHWQSGMLPQDKTAAIKQLQEQKRHVLMVGDGLNDAPSLAQADVSMSPASGMDMTQNSADIVFQGDRLAPVLHSWRMARFSTTLVKQNFMLAVLYNCLAIPLAVAGYVTPLIAAIAMSSSSLIVIANSFRIHMIQEEGTS